jgi:hypothetical protein
MAPRAPIPIRRGVPKHNNAATIGRSRKIVVGLLGGVGRRCGDETGGERYFDQACGDQLRDDVDAAADDLIKITGRGSMTRFPGL